LTNSLTIALPKGRILEQALPLLEAADLRLLEDPERSRKLVLDTTSRDVRVVVIRAADVPTYVQYGAADAGIVGKDVLLEHGGEGLYEPLDLKIAACRLVVAACHGHRPGHGRLRVASKYPQLTRRHFAKQGRQVEVIKLHGSMELAPLVGLCDCIVDLVDTGKTLRANGLEPLETIASITSRLVVNKAAMKMKYRRIHRLLEELGSAVADRSSKPMRTDAGCGSQEQALKQ
jgi:ATP phosphoribosyltransferase